MVKSYVYHFIILQETNQFIRAYASEEITDLSLAATAAAHG